MSSPLIQVTLLPPVIEKRIFTLAASEKRTLLSLRLVSIRVKAYVDPILFRTITFWTTNAGRMTELLKNQSTEFLTENVYGAHISSRGKDIFSVLYQCHHLTYLVLSAYDRTPGLIDLWKFHHLRYLSLNYKSGEVIASLLKEGNHDPLPVTHLSFASEHIGDLAPTILKYFPQLTHLMCERLECLSSTWQIYELLSSGKIHVWVFLNFSGGSRHPFLKWLGSNNHPEIVVLSEPNELAWAREFWNGGQNPDIPDIFTWAKAVVHKRRDHGQ
ncbi:hypothetical protein DL96DRAFT_1589865 [Flagelloscypha sp. PMI_526]|nr:hypothetical protein DL96DRAFT_1589865 [Flagelloscypha sp. PMI_526]